jgi:hypothetical protein
MIGKCNSDAILAVLQVHAMLTGTDY